MRRDSRRPSPENAPRPRYALALLQDFMRRQKNRGHRERHQVVNRAKGNERAQNRRRGKEWREKDEDDRLENAQASGHIADHASDLRQKENAEKTRERQRQRIGEEDVEDAGSDDPVERRDGDLRDEKAECRQLEFPLPQTNRLSANGDPEEIEDRRQKQNDPQQPDGVERNMHRRGNLGRRSDEQRAA